MDDRPAEWVVENLPLLPQGLPVLDVAAGAGRHTLFLAAHGWSVHAVDHDEDALRRLLDASRGLPGAITTEVRDLEGDRVQLGVEAYGVVVVIHYLHRPLIPAIIAAIRRGGVLIYETFTVAQAARGHPRNPRFLLAPGELPTLVTPLEILRHREGDFEGRWVSSIVAVKR
ncbi:MAG: class I SAM-dependent methyltransferase [Acidobacteriota bacterium]